MWMINFAAYFLFCLLCGGLAWWATTLTQLGRLQLILVPVFGLAMVAALVAALMTAFAESGEARQESQDAPRRQRRERLDQILIRGGARPVWGNSGPTRRSRR